LHEIEIAQSMEKIMLEDRLGKRFTHKEMIILGGTLELEKVMEGHFELINKIPQKFKTIYKP